MKILQDKDGNGIMAFSDKEIEIIKKQAHFKIPAEALRHLTNQFMFISLQASKKFDEKTKNTTTTLDTEIDTKE